MTKKNFFPKKKFPFQLILSSFVTADKIEMEDPQCPICMEVMVQPIYKCCFGHNICFQCFQNIETCPSCRSELATFSRNEAAEEKTAQLDVHCRNFDCEFVGKGKEISKHEESECSHKKFRCPFYNPSKEDSEFPTCKVVGTMDVMMKHAYHRHVTRSPYVGEIDMKDLSSDESVIYWSFVQSWPEESVTVYFALERKSNSLKCGAFYYGMNVIPEHYKIKIIVGTSAQVFDIPLSYGLGENIVGQFLHRKLPIEIMSLDDAIEKRCENRCLPCEVKLLKSEEDVKSFEEDALEQYKYKLKIYIEGLTFNIVKHLRTAPLHYF